MITSFPLRSLQWKKCGQQKQNVYIYTSHPNLPSDKEMVSIACRIRARRSRTWKGFRSTHSLDPRDAWTFGYVVRTMICGGTVKQTCHRARTRPKNSAASYAQSELRSRSNIADRAAGIIVCSSQVRTACLSTHTTLR